MCKMKAMLEDMLNEPMLVRCPECDGSGEIEVDVPRPHAGGFNEGYIDTEYERCPECEGELEVQKTCVECGDGIFKVYQDERQGYIINGLDQDKCEECCQ